MAPIVDRPYPRLVVRSLLPALALVVAGAVVLSACDAQFLPEAARVNGAIVSQSTLNSALDSVASDAGYRCLLESAAGSAHAVTGVSNGTYNTSFAAGALSLLIEAKAADVAVAREHLVVAPLARQVARAELATSFTPSSGSSCTEPGAEVLSTLGGGFAGALVSLQVDEDVLAAHAVGYTITTSGVRAYVQHHASATALDCTEAIEVASRAKAEQLAIAIIHGASFATVAEKNSLDASASRWRRARLHHAVGADEPTRRHRLVASGRAALTASEVCRRVDPFRSDRPTRTDAFGGGFRARPRRDERRFEGTRELRRQGPCRGRSALRHLGEGRQLL